MWQVTSRLKEEVVKQTFTFITFLWVRYVSVTKLTLLSLASYKADGKASAESQLGDRSCPSSLTCFWKDSFLWLLDLRSPRSRESVCPWPVACSCPQLLATCSSSWGSWPHGSWLHQDEQVRGTHVIIRMEVTFFL